MSTWTAIVIGILGLIASAAVNIFIVGVYIGQYKSDLRDCRTEIHDMKEERKGERELMSNMRERLRWCESRLNGKGWRTEP